MQACGLEFPERITSTKLRKYLATVSQVSLSDNFHIKTIQTLLLPNQMVLEILQFVSEIMM